MGLLVEFKLKVDTNRGFPLQFQINKIQGRGLDLSWFPDSHLFMFFIVRFSKIDETISCGFKNHVLLEYQPLPEYSVLRFTGRKIIVTK